MTYREFWQPLTARYDEGEAKAITRLVAEVRYGLTLADVLAGRLETVDEHQLRQLQQSRLLENSGLRVCFIGCCHIAFLCGAVQRTGIEVKKIFPAECQCFIGTSLTDGLGTTKPAPVTGVLLTFAFVCQLCNGLDALAPVLQLLTGTLKRRDIIQTRLDDAHADVLDIIQKAIGD